MWGCVLDRYKSTPVAGIVISLILHAGVLYGWSDFQPVTPSVPTQTLYVNFVTLPAPQKLLETAKHEAVQKQRVQSLKPVRIIQHQPREALPLVMVARTVAEPVAVTYPLVVAPHPPIVKPLALFKPVEPTNLSAELAVSCPERISPRYPSLSRRMGEEGRVIVRVELDADGSVAVAQVLTSSGASRLDEAALLAVKQWRCNPAQRDGHAVRAVAMQPFNFTLAGF